MWRLIGRYPSDKDLKFWKSANLICRKRSSSSSTSGSSTLSNNEESSQRIHVTMKWLDSIVIGQKLCPFAPPVSREPQLRIKISNTSSYDDIIRDVEAEVHLLVGDYHDHTDQDNSKINSFDDNILKRPETTLIVLNENKCSSLQDFLELVRLSWRIQEEAINQHGYTELVQQVLFHPLATHDTYGISMDEEGDAADYTIRSPFPIIHLLREVDVMNAVTSGYKDLEGLPSRNKARMRRDGVAICARRLEACQE